MENETLVTPTGQEELAEEVAAAEAGVEEVETPVEETSTEETAPVVEETSTEETAPVVE